MYNRKRFERNYLANYYFLPDAISIEIFDWLYTGQTKTSNDTDSWNYNEIAFTINKRNEFKRSTLGRCT